MTAMTTPAIVRVHLHGIGPAQTDLYESALTLLHSITPLVMALPPDAADLDITGARRVHHAHTHEEVAHIVRLRLAAHLGLQATLGMGPTRMLAAMAAQATPSGHLTVVPAEPDHITRWLRPRPAAHLPGIGPATARTLTTYGLHTIGALADTPLLTLQRLLGTALGRQLHDRARGHDPRPVTPQTPPQSTTATRHFTRDELDPAAHRRTVLALTEEIGLRLRTTAHITTALALSVRYADGSTTTRSRTLTEATAHTTALAATGRLLLDGLGLQRARVRALTLRADLRPAQEAVHQLTLDPCDDKARAVEAAADRARARFGPTAVRSATLATPPHRHRTRGDVRPDPYGRQHTPTPHGKQ